MYNFTGLTESAKEIALSSIQTIFNNVNLDIELTTDKHSFKTLNVTGRSHYDVDSQAVDVNGRDGAYFIDSKLEPRTLTVEASIEANTNENFRELTAKLNKILFSRKPVKISFTDENDWFFNAQYINSNNPKENNNSQIVELNFICYDPYKYKEEETIQASNSERLKLDTMFPVVADEIIISFSSQPEEIRIFNTQTEKRIVFKLQQNLSKSSRLILNQNETFIGYTRQQNAFGSVDLKHSDFKTLTFNRDEQIVVQPTPSNITIKYRGVRL